MTSPNNQLAIYLAIAFLIGVLITTMIFWLMYSQRWLVYRNCPRQVRTCAGDDYIQNPEDALAAGYTLNNRLAVSAGKLLYERPVNNTDCRPSSAPVTIDYPMYCVVDGELYRNRLPGHSSYISEDGTVKRFDAHCTVEGRQGSPLAKWDRQTR